MATLINPFGTGTIEERHQQRLKNDAALAAKQTAPKNTTTETIVSIVSDLRPSYDSKGKISYDPLFESHINKTEKETIDDILDAIGYLNSDEESSESEIIEKMSRSFILIRQEDGRYIKSDLILHIRKHLLGKGYMVYDGGGNEIGSLDYVFEHLTEVSTDVSASETDEPDINDCRDVTMDARFGQF